MAFRSKIKAKFGKANGKAKVPMSFVDDGEDGEDEDNPFTMGGGGGSGGRLPKKRKMKQAVVSAFGLGSEDAGAGDAQEVRSYDQEDLHALKSTQNFHKAEAALAAALGVKGTASNDVADTDMGIIMEGDAAEEAEFSGVAGAGVGGGSEQAQTQTPVQTQAQGVTQQTQSFQKLASQASSGSGSVNIHSMLELLQSSVREAEDLSAGEGRRAALLSEQLAAVALCGDAEDPATKAKMLQARVVLLDELHAYSRGAMGTLGANEARVEALVGAAMDVRGSFTAATEDASHVAASEAEGGIQGHTPEALVGAEAALQSGMSRLREAGGLLLHGTSIAQICDKFAYLRRNLPDLYASAYLDDCLEIALTPMVTHHLALLDPFAAPSAAEHGHGTAPRDTKAEGGRASRPRPPGLAAGPLGDPLALESVLALMAAGPAAKPTAGLESESCRGGLLAGLIKSAVLPWLRRCVTAFFSPVDTSQCEQLRRVLEDCHQALDRPNQGADVETSAAVLSAFRRRMNCHMDRNKEVEGKEVEVEGAEGLGSDTAATKTTTAVMAAARVALLTANLKVLESVLPDAQTTALFTELAALSSSSSSKPRRLSRFDEAPVQ
jgi:hypothetical protein